MKKQKLNEVQKSKAILNYCKKAWQKDPVSFFILHGLKYLGNNFFINKNHKERLNKNTRSYMYVYVKYVGMR